ncbi:rhodanese-like domain-containing protein [Glaciecola sp. SC05]|uniref:rhodanese-like domain-containing protein n=1 Tax=Glaciecola sp. SC05 TaxID=1987355 RepID=UPI0035277766
MNKFFKVMIAMAMLLSMCVSAEDKVQYQAFDSDVQVIDVRSDAEWKEGHHPAAMHLPHTTILEGEGFAGLDKNKPVVLYCRSGGRAERAKDFLEAQGFTNVTNLGGISDLVVSEKDD